MNNLPQIFMYQGTQIRTVIKDNEPWWVAKDVCEVFGDTNYRRSIARLDEDEKGVSPLTTPGGLQQMTIINESGLYTLLFQMQPQKKAGMDEQYESKSEALRGFKRWVTHEVLPTIRNHGAYMTADTIEKTLTSPDFIIQLATRLKEEQAAREREQQARLLAESQIAADRHKVIFAESLEVSQDSILIGQLAKLLKQNGIEMGEVRLFKWMRDNGYLIKSGSEYNMPSQKSMELKIMEIKLGSRLSITEGSKVTKTTKVTGKGAMYFINKFKQKQVTA